MSIININQLLKKTYQIDSKILFYSLVILSHFRRVEHLVFLSGSGLVERQPNSRVLIVILQLYKSDNSSVYNNVTWSAHKLSLMCNNMRVPDVFPIVKKIGSPPVKLLQQLSTEPRNVFGVALVEGRVRAGGWPHSHPSHVRTFPPWIVFSFGIPTWKKGTDRTEYSDELRGWFPDWEIYNMKAV